MTNPVAVRDDKNDEAQQSLQQGKNL